MANKRNIDGAGGIQVTLSQQEAKQFLLLLRELIILQEIQFSSNNLPVSSWSGVVEAYGWVLRSSSYDVW